MMRIIVTIEPDGDASRARQIGNLEVWNESGLAETTSNYGWEAKLEGGKSYKGEVRAHIRSHGWVPLVERVLDRLSAAQCADLAAVEVVELSDAVHTSVEAAARMERDGSRVRRLVFRTIAHHNGLTCQEVVVLTGLIHATASARISELYKRGLLRDSGERRQTKSRRMAIVWMVPSPDEKKNEGGTP